MDALSSMLAVLMFFPHSVNAAVPHDNPTLSSPAFADGAVIPQQFTADGRGISPPLKWRGIPRGSKELVVIATDSDAPNTRTSEPFTHWVIYGISPRSTGLPPSIPAGMNVSKPLLAEQGKNSEGREGYSPPNPPETDSMHHYHFKLFALDQSMSLPPGLGESQVIAAMKGHVIGESELTGLYGRS